MGRIAPFFIRAAVIACACAILFLCVRAAHAQGEDRYGFIPLPAPSLTPEQTPRNSGPPPAPAMAAPDGGRFDTRRMPGGTYAPDPGINASYLLGPGDRLHVTVLGEDDLSGDVQIDGAGMMRMPLIGSLGAAGFTAPALENIIAGVFAQGYLKNPRVLVAVTAYRPFTITGAVNRPGQYPYVANMSALSAISYGGGFTDQAKESIVYVRHEGSTAEEAVPASQATLIRPGDVIRVKDSVFWDAIGIF